MRITKEELVQLGLIYPDKKDMIHLQKEEAYLHGWEEGREALRKEQPEPCEDAVSRKEVLHSIDALVNLSDDGLLEPEDVVVAVTYLPSVTPKMRTGKWMLAEDGWYCSACELYPPFDCDPEEKGIPYCPWCCADMREGDE